ncbi:MAG: hypothetical protein FJ395_03700 [Verrucomicrobia bacterium]|nr:hypothetical protein [Verrucomicrobiota bacterium]
MKRPRTIHTQRLLWSCLSAWLLTATVALGDNEGIEYPAIGKIKPHHAKEIAGSNWSVGAETMDRDFTVYRHWKDYLGPLGIKKARIQAGWAKTEQVKGVYDFAWLDEAVFDMPRHGVTPWMCLSYGNPIYEGGGQASLMGGVPTSDVALAAWARWVRANVVRYRDVITEWEVWNEPNYKVAAQDYARLFVLTAETVRSAQSNATIIAFGLGSGVNYKYAGKVLEILKEQDKLHLIDQISHHRHQGNPDVRGPEIELEKLVTQYSDRIVIRQGEAGCPSEIGKKRAMANYPWTELIQAKHVLRRLLGDLGRDKESSVFAIMDMKYPDEMNRKGLLRSRDDGTVEYPKPAYYAVQNLAAVFDNRLARIKDFLHEAKTDLPLTAYAYRHQPSGRAIVTVWIHDEVPGNDNRKTAADFRFHQLNFTQPVYVDLRTGRVHEIPRGRWSREGETALFKQVPVYDSPVLIADKATLPLTSGR